MEPLDLHQTLHQPPELVKVATLTGAMEGLVHSVHLSCQRPTTGAWRRVVIKGGAGWDGRRGESGRRRRTSGRNWLADAEGGC